MSSVIRALLDGEYIAVASAMFTQRARAGCAKARRAGANERALKLGSLDRRARAEARIEGLRVRKLEARRCSSGDVQCHFVARAPSRKHQALHIRTVPLY